MKNFITLTLAAAIMTANTTAFAVPIPRESASIGAT